MTISLSNASVDFTDADAGARREGHQPGKSSSLRGWRPQERESSNLSFRTIRLTSRSAFGEPQGSLMAGRVINVPESCTQMFAGPNRSLTRL